MRRVPITYLDHILISISADKQFKSFIYNYWTWLCLDFGAMHRWSHIETFTIATIRHSTREQWKRDSGKMWVISGQSYFETVNFRS